MPTGYEVWKEVLERVGAGLVLLIASPLLLSISAGIIMDSKGNPIFTQLRIGKDRKGFKLYKFRTMFQNNNETEYKSYIQKLIKKGEPYSEDSQGPIYKLANDRRVTRFGRLLRKVDLDELPQFINVLKGDLSLVGPRPDIPEAVDAYEDWHLERLAVKPGLTGLWQISARDRVSFEDMVRIDLNYIRNRSLGLDFKILLLTVPSIAARALSKRRSKNGKDWSHRLRLLGAESCAQLPGDSSSDTVRRL